MQSRDVFSSDKNKTIFEPRNRQSLPSRVGGLTYPDSSMHCVFSSIGLVFSSILLKDKHISWMTNNGLTGVGARDTCVSKKKKKKKKSKNTMKPKLLHAN